MPRELDASMTTTTHMRVNRHSRLYWVVTGLMSTFMLMGAIPDLVESAQAAAAFSHLGYPAYLLRFIGTAKVLGVAAVLVPGLPRLREWAYAGLVFDLTGALYSHLSVGDPASIWIFAVVGLVLVTGSYLLQRAERKPVPHT
jgi:hypothetical protein